MYIRGKREKSGRYARKSVADIETADNCLIAGP